MKEQKLAARRLERPVIRSEGARTFGWDDQRLAKLVPVPRP